MEIALRFSGCSLFDCTVFFACIECLPEEADRLCFQLFRIGGDTDVFYVISGGFWSFDLHGMTFFSK